MSEKFRRVRLLLYPEDLTHLNALNIIIESGFKYIYILHDKDSDEHGELKKKHWHVVLQFKNARYISGIAKQLKITENYILPCDHFQDALYYLLHLNQPSKYQYSLEECVGNLVGQFKDFLDRDSKSECEKVLDILDYIDNTCGYCSYTSLVRYCADVGSFDVLRRSGIVLVRCIDEHNQKSGFNSSDNSSK